MKPDIPDAPGLKWRKRKGGDDIAYWVARSDKVEQGYPVKTVRIPYQADDPGWRIKVAQRCRVLQAEMLEWKDGGARKPTFDGTVRALAEMYQVANDSPYHDKRPKTRRFYDYALKVLVEHAGEEALARVTGADVRRWYKSLRKPVAEDKPERVRRARAAIQLLSIIVNFGRSMRVKSCKDLSEVLEAMEFAGSAPRSSHMTHAHVEAFRAKAHELGRPSMALGVTLQFGLSMRQRDVIGEWVKTDEPPTAGIHDGTWRWEDGLTFAHISGGVLSKKTSKTATLVEHDLSLHPDVMAELSLIPAARRIGPLVISESSGLPYKPREYPRQFRLIARAAGIPDTVWNMDARAGAVTEAFGAGASTSDVMQTTGHTQPSTTNRYNRTTLTQSSRVATLRVASRQNGE